MTADVLCVSTCACHMRAIARHDEIPFGYATKLKFSHGPYITFAALDELEVSASDGRPLRSEDRASPSAPIRLPRAETWYPASSDPKRAGYQASTSGADVGVLGNTQSSDRSGLRSEAETSISKRTIRVSKQ